MAIAYNLCSFHGNQSATHHLLEFRQKSVDFLGRIDDLDDHRQVKRQAQNVGIVEVGGSAKSHASTKDSGSSYAEFSSSKYDRFVEWPMPVLVGFA
jgi:hypothetical protein